MNYSGSAPHAPQNIREHLFISISPNRGARSNNGTTPNDLHMLVGFSAPCYITCVQGQENTRIAGLTHPECCASAHQAVIAPTTLSR